MEQLIQKYVRYFYVALIGGILIELFNLTFVCLKGEICYKAIILLFLSVMNILLLLNNLKHNKKQQFTECKENSKILRFTMAIFVIFQAILHLLTDWNWVVLGNYLITITVIEIVFDYRIKSIEYLERLADKYIKDKGE